MYINNKKELKTVTCSNISSSCVDEFNCGSSCPDFILKRHDTKPDFKVEITDCNGPMDLSGLVLEASMWANAKLKTAIDTTDTYFYLADNIGFQQVLVGDIIVFDRVRTPEQLLVTGIDENLKLIRVQRGYNSTPAGDYKKGSKLKIFRVLNAVAQIELTYQDRINIDGTTTEDVLTKSELSYEWNANDTCLPGCYNFEFKLIKMTASMSLSMTSLVSTISTPSFASYTSDEYGCSLGSGVEWVRRFPVDRDGFIVKISESFTSENLT